MTNILDISKTTTENDLHICDMQKFFIIILNKLLYILGFIPHTPVGLKSGSCTNLESNFLNKYHARSFGGAVNLNVKLRRLLNGGNFT
jgi:hypothetical protein